MSVQVLVADDEALIRQSLRATLAREGFDVSVAASGSETWLRFQEDKPDTVLLDLVLGDADGIDVLRRMRQEAPDTKVILISARPGGRGVARGLSLPVRLRPSRAPADAS